MTTGRNKLRPHTGRRPPQGHGGWNAPIYRCVYCRREYKSKEELPGHEARCDVKDVVERMWAATLERAKMAEARRR